ncbi:SRPBCC family protein [Mycetocola zhujimingii]|uniref:Activator of Hsp90 ATPase homologue 1/2-like C-terminal domain-containing protein n=1 Tax=Mycetocola zhujimingii TaxID=2079792 RepID=A0A2U1TBW6_9MICO|nr:SRPBCC domain-containing protein [Mycetocola zhujimingii]PWC06385.1 hypothetical protein DF223_12345 [Mycetocola zhujimingii]
MIATYELHRGFTLVCRLDAPRTAVFRAWTDPAHLDWFYNDAAPMPAEPIDVDLRVGGAWRQQMVVDEFTKYVTGGIYREISPVDRLVFSWGAVGGWPEITMSQLGDVPLVTVILGDADETDAADVGQSAGDRGESGADSAVDTAPDNAPDNAVASEADRAVASAADSGVALGADRRTDAATDMVFSFALPDHLTAQQARAWAESGVEENWGLTLDRLVAAVSGERQGDARDPRGR